MEAPHSAYLPTGHIMMHQTCHTVLRDGTTDIWGVGSCFKLGLYSSQLPGLVGALLRWVMLSGNVIQQAIGQFKYAITSIG